MRISVLVLALMMLNGCAALGLGGDKDEPAKEKPACVKNGGHCKDGDYFIVGSQPPACTQKPAEKCGAITEE